MGKIHDLTSLSDEMLENRAKIIKGITELGKISGRPNTKEETNDLIIHLLEIANEYIRRIKEPHLVKERMASVNRLN